jgi:PAS domain S-box-containing protein
VSKEGLSRAQPAAPASDAGQAATPLVGVAARGAVVFGAAFGALLCVVSLLQLLAAGGPTLRSGVHLALGLALGAAAALGQRLIGRGHARMAALVVMWALLLGVTWLAWVLGIGLHAVMLGGLCLLVAVAGLLLGLRAAAALAAGYLLCVLALYGAEFAGVIEGAARAASAPLGERLLAHAMLMGAGLLAAALLHRMVGAQVAAAVAEQQRLAELLQIGIDWTWEMDAKGRITAVSPSFEASTGRTVAEFMQLGQPGGPQILPGEGYTALLEDMRARRPYREREVTFRCTDGTQIFVIGNGQPVLGADGRVLRWIGATRNVTHERLAERERARTRAMLDRMVHTSPDAICVARGNGEIRLCNQGFAQLVGRPEAEVLGKSGVELGLWSLDESIRLRDALRRDGATRDFRTRLRTQAGDERQVSLSAGVFAWDGEDVAVISVRDITELERARRESELIVHNARVGIAFVRMGVFERVNPQLERMLGRRAGELIGRPTLEALAGVGDPEAYVQQTRQALSRGELVDDERDFLRPDGSTIRLRLRAQSIEPGHVALGTIWVAEDVTEERRVEQALAAARAQAEAASQAKSSFLATMSHEIRTPLNGVLGLAQLLQEPGVSAERRAEYLRHLLASAAQLSGLVSDVLDLSKIEAGHLQLESLPFDLHELLDSVFESQAALGRERGLQMRLVLAPGLPRRVVGDAMRVRQILANLLGNALKFTPRGHVTLAASTTRAGALLLAVRDSGIGFEPAASERLFSPFSQADSSTTRRFGGTGLGLSICRELAERMGGSAHGQSTGPGQGSTFWVELPLPAADDDAGAVAPHGATTGRLQGMTVLLAEDNEVNRLIVRTMLERHGAAVLEAEDGALAVAHATREAARLDAILMDLHMPSLDGLAATRLLRAQPATSGVPIVALSAAVLESARQQAAAAGMLDFLAKPVAEAELVRVLTALRRA